MRQSVSASYSLLLIIVISVCLSPGLSAAHWSDGRSQPVSLFDGTEIGKRNGYVTDISTFVLDSFETPPVSKWLREDREVFRNALADFGGEVLLLPPQLHARGFPTAIRQVMSHRLEAMALRQDVNLVADQNLLMRAFVAQRTFADADVWKVADASGATKIIAPHVGFAAFESDQVKLAVAIVEFEKDPALGWQKSRTSEQLMLPFDWENPPDVVYTQALHQLSSWLGYQVSIPENTVSHSDRPWLPQLGADTAIMATGSAVERARYYQLLGAVTPHDSKRTREGFFAQSLQILTSFVVSEKSADSLRARAYMELGMAPYAHQLVSSSSSKTSQCYGHFLKSNLPQLEKCIEEETNSINQLLLSIELHRLAGLFDRDTRDYAAKSLGYLAGHESWIPFVSSYFRSADRWDLPDSTWIKEILDEQFPVDGLTMQNIEASAVLGNKQGSWWIDTAPFKHYRVYLQRNSKAVITNQLESRGRLDLLDLLMAHATETLLRKARRFALLQGLPEHTLEYADNLDAEISGHPAAAYVRALGHSSAVSMSNNVRTNFHTENALEYFKRVLFWEQENTSLASDARRYNLNADASDQINWDADFPLSTRDTPHSDELTLARFSLDFSYFEYVVTGRLARKESLGDLKNWFIGHPDRDAIFLNSMQKQGELQTAKVLAERVVQNAPDRFQGYEDLANVVRKTADLDAVSEIFLRYPPFQKIQSDNQIEHSNQAGAIGVDLMWSGRPDLAQKFFEISTAYRSGSAYNLIAEMRLHQMKGNLLGMISTAQNHAQRYGGAPALRDYLGLLVLIDRADDVLHVFDNIVADQSDIRAWVPAFAAQRSLGWDQQRVVGWLKREHLEAVNKPWRAKAIFYVRSLTVDRGVEDVDIEFLREQSPLQRLPAVAVDKAQAGIDKPLANPSSTDDSFVGGTPMKTFKSDAEVYAQAHQYVVQGRYEDAIAAIDDRSPIQPAPSPFLINLYAFAAHKTNQLSKLEDSLNAMSQFADRLEYKLGLALLYGFSGDTDIAVGHLQRAMSGGESTRSRYDLPYLTAQAMDMLWEETGEDVYRGMALDWAKDMQIVEYYHGWPYALAAKFCLDPDAQLQYATQALYLDPRSLWLQSVPEPILMKAKQRLGDHGPFFEAVESQKQALESQGSENPA